MKICKKGIEKMDPFTIFLRSIFWNILMSQDQDRQSEQIYGYDKSIVKSTIQIHNNNNVVGKYSSGFP